MSYARISADSHVDVHWLPADLFVKNAPAALKDRMPFVVDGEDPHWTTKKNIWIGYVSGFGPYGQKYVAGSNSKIDIMASTGLYADAKRGRRRVSDPVLRQQDMNLDGVDAEVVYGLAAETLMRLEDPEVATEMCRIYNDWLVDFCRGSNRRLFGLACIYYSDIDASVKEVYRIAEYRRAGIVGINLATTRETRPLWHPSWEPLWKAISDVGLPLHIHCFRSLPLTLEEIDVQGQSKRAAFFTSVTGFQMASLVHPLAALIGSGVLERYPRLQVVLGESGLGWLPYVLERMDHEFNGRFGDLELKMKPSEYWRRQCKAVFQNDRIGIKLIDELGADSIMWGSDYPHSDGTWPESSRILAQLTAGLSPEVIRKITCDNAAQIYGISALPGLAGHAGAQ
jgi:predicted TIM-barrel fold metal-dependent hydrolase